MEIQRHFDKHFDPWPERSFGDCVRTEAEDFADVALDSRSSVHSIHGTLGVGNNPRDRALVWLRRDLRAGNHVAMQPINQSGQMYKQLRMVVASFLSKHLGQDWRRGDSCFALHLNDFDLTANNGGWQRAVSSGCAAHCFHEPQ